MEAAIRLARAAAVREEVPIGAIIVHEGRVIAEANNETIARGIRPHAEIWRFERSEAVGRPLLDATLYVTLEPCCPMRERNCVIRQGRTVVFGRGTRGRNMAGSVHDLLRHRGSITAGGVRRVLEEECGEASSSSFVAPVFSGWGRRSRGPVGGCHPPPPMGPVRLEAGCRT
jgi:tRNA(Arg) A34 adenosine deaminase TadA